MLPDFPFFPEPASHWADSVDALFFYLMAVTAFFTCLIAVLVIGLAIHYRHSKPVNRDNPSPGNLRLELIWAIIPLVITMASFAWGAKIYFDESRAPDRALEIYVVGKQWMWKIQHPEGKREINELHVPVGLPVKLTMSSEDVIHSFFIPAFRIKMDVLPGRYSNMWFTPTKEGTYHLFCAEYCGTNHSRMIGRVVVLSPIDYQRWLEGATTEPLDQQGQKLFERLACQSCHSDTATARGPSLKGLFGSEVTLQGGAVVRADESYFRESLLRPAARIVAGFAPVMPSFEGQLSEEDILALVAYVKSLGPALTSGTPADGERKNR